MAGNRDGLTATIAAAGGAVPRPDPPFDGIDLLPALTGKAHMEAERPIFFAAAW